MIRLFHFHNSIFWCASLAVWGLLTLAIAFQGHIFAAYQGKPQDWWSSLGYTAAIFSVWAALTPVVLWTFDRVTAANLRGEIKILLIIFGLPLATALHLLGFAFLFWPIYGVGVPTPLAMVEPVFKANLDTLAFAYIALLSLAHVRRLGITASKPETEPEPKPSLPSSIAEGIWIKNGGVTRLILHKDIDWISAAGDYAEVHAGDCCILSEMSLSALDDALPRAEFARIHRGAIVRLDRVRQVVSLGRGDANLQLDGGHVLRLSRRYREGLSKLGSL